MLGQRRRQWADISPALDKRVMVDRLHDKKRWTKMNGTLTDRNSQTHRHHLTQLKQHVSTSVYRYEKL